MGGWEHTRNGGHGRPVRSAAVCRAAARGAAARGAAARSTAVRRAALLLLVAVGVAAGVAFLCARPPEAHAPEPVRAAHGAHAVCVSPYDPPGCSPISDVTPAVLPAPPPLVSASGASAVPAAPRATAAGPVRPPGTLARAPDLYALRVLRT